MGRWAPEAESRLRAAALELYEERGYDATTVADIADRAGLTARTFFRYFVDKREVLFGGSEILMTRFVTAARSAPADAGPVAVVGVALDEFAALVGENRDWARRRRAVIDATPELQERELVKLATMASALAAVLRERGVPDPDAALAAEVGLAVVRVGFDTWTSTQTDEPLTDLLRAAMGRLQGVVSTD